MILRILPIIGAVALGVLPGPAAAGPCTAQIDAMQAAVDAKIMAVAAAGPTGTESEFALRNRQPTPNSMVQAEEKLGEGSQLGNALRAVRLAREADRVDDKAACENALVQARRALEQTPP